MIYNSAMAIAEYDSGCRSNTIHQTIIIIFLSKQRTRVRTEVTKITGHKKKNKKQRDGQQRNKTSLKLKEWRTINLEGKE